MKNIKIPLFLKFAVIMITLSVGPLTFVGIRTVNINKEALQTSILELHTQLAKSFSEKVNYYISEIQNEIPYITNILSIEDVSITTVNTVLKTVVDSHQNIVCISLIDNTGKEKTKIYNPSLIMEPSLLDLSKDETFKYLQKNNLTQAISPLFYYNEDPRLNLFYRVRKNIIVLITITLKSLWNELDEIHLGKTGHAFLVDHEGKIIAHREKNLINKKPEKIPIIERAINAISIGSSEYIDQNGIEMVGAYAPVQNLRWAIIVQQPKKEAYYSSILMQKQAILLIIVSILLSGGIAFLFAENLTKPILELIKASGRIAKRDFTVRVKRKTRDELNDLISTFNSMTEELKKYDDMQIDKIIAEKTKTEAIIFSIGDGIVMTNREGEILLINQKARDILGIEPGNLEGKFLWNSISRKQLIDVFNELLNMPDESKEARTKEVDLSGKTYSRFYKIITAPVTTVKGEKLGLVTVLRDITLEKELDKMKDDFLHSITHDLRNPMTSIRGFIKFLIDGVGGTLTEQQKKMIETMDRASVRLLSMINDILDLAKLESGKIDIQLSDVDLIDITQKILELLQPHILKKSIETKVETLD
ncbi:MAG: cache domain-containing protein, partial [Endomicrobiia bacterium]